MKKYYKLRILVPSILALLSYGFIMAQSPSMISYQAVIRDLSGEPLPNADKSIKFTILQGNIDGAQVFTETHAAHTNALGLVNLQIGSISPGLQNTDWSNGPYFLKVEVDAIVMGTTQLLSVPYALFSGNGFKGNSPYFIDDGNVGIGTNDPKSTLSVAGTTVNDSAIFEVKNNNGLTVFAVYNEGVRINIDETTKASKGGFAIGGFSNTKGVSRDLMRISTDSIRMYINNTPSGKGSKGGFAIGGFDKSASKAAPVRYLDISGNEGTSGSYNNFIGYKAGNTLAGGTHNISIGYLSGSGLGTSSKNNIFIGDSAGMNTSGGFENIFIGRNAGSKMFVGYNNIYIGYRAGSEGHGQYNVFIGDQSGRYNNNGWSNVFVGNAAGKGVSNGYQNTLIGTQSGWKIGTGQENTFVGATTGFNSVNSNGNTFIGSQAGDFNVDGDNNTYVGKWAGMQALGSGNIFIGAGAGYGVTAGDNQLIIDNNTNSTVTTALIGGDMLNDKLRLNAAVGIKTDGVIGVSLTVNGEVKATTLTQTSDARLKRDVATITDPLTKVLALRGVSFNWNEQEPFDSKRHMGMIAQEVYATVPEAISTAGDFYSIEYAPITAILVEAVKELKIENDLLKEKVNKIDDLESQIEELKSIVSAISNK